jgi:hypothetical protein
MGKLDSRPEYFSNVRGGKSGLRKDAVAVNYGRE